MDLPATNPKFSGNHLILLPKIDSKENYLKGFWQWITFLANDDYPGAIEAIQWPKSTVFTPEDLRERVTKFWGGSKTWSVVVPNDRLIGVINSDAEFQTARGNGWFMALIPVTTEPAKAKADDIPLQGVAVSFFVREFQDRYVLEFELFHL